MKYIYWKLEKFLSFIYYIVYTQNTLCHLCTNFVTLPRSIIMSSVSPNVLCRMLRNFPRSSPWAAFLSVCSPSSVLNSRIRHSASVLLTAQQEEYSRPVWKIIIKSSSIWLPKSLLILDFCTETTRCKLLYEIREELLVKMGEFTHCITYCSLLSNESTVLHL